MYADLILAILHHAAIFALAGVIAAELALVRPGLTARGAALVGRIDAAYGGLAMAIIVIGVCRVIFGLKGWEFYVYYWAFWVKMVAFGIVGLLSIAPTMRILRWRREAVAPGYTVPDAEIAGVRSWLKAEAAIFLLIPVFAAIMARGVGY